MKIIHLITQLGFGGAERVVLDLAQSMKSENEVTVISLTDNTEMVPIFKEHGVNTIHLQWKKSFSGFIKLQKDINQQLNGCNVLHVHLTFPLFFIFILRIKYPKLRIVFTSHSENIPSKLHRILVWSSKLFRDYDIIFSERMKNSLYKKKCKIIPNGVDLNAYDLKLPKNERFTFVAVGRLFEVKNHIALIELWKNLKEQIDAQLLIVGEGPERDVLEAKIREYQLDETVKLLGLRTDIPEILNQSHVLLHPSLWEGLPIVILEAIAANIPVVATPVGAIPATMNDENNIVLLEKWHERIVDLYKNYDENCNAIAENYKRIRHDISLETIAQEHMNLYKKVLGHE